MKALCEKLDSKESELRDYQRELEENEGKLRRASGSPKIPLKAAETDSPLGLSFTPDRPNNILGEQKEEGKVIALEQMGMSEDDQKMLFDTFGTDESKTMPKAATNIVVSPNRIEHGWHYRRFGIAGALRVCPQEAGMRMCGPGSE